MKKTKIISILTVCAIAVTASLTTAASAINVNAKTITRISKETPFENNLTIRMGKSMKFKVTLYTNGASKPSKKVKFTSKKKKIVSIGKVKYKKKKYKDWYGRKHTY